MNKHTISINQEKRSLKLKLNMNKKVIIELIKFVILIIMFWTILTTIVFWIILFSETKVNADEDSANKKIEWLIEQGANKEFAQELMKECKGTAKSPNHCFIVGASIAKAESNYTDIWWWYFWLQSEEKTINRWIKSYNLYWYKAKDWFFFYWDWGKLGKSQYCTDELSSWSKLWCPNGRKNFHTIWDEYKKLFGTN